MNKNNCEKKRENPQTNTIKKQKNKTNANTIYTKLRINIIQNSYLLAKLYVYRLFITFTCLNDMNETNLLIEGHNTCLLAIKK